MSVRQGEHEVPLWICDELVVETQRLWMKKCRATFEKDDVIDLLVTLERLLDNTGLLKMEQDDEEVHGFSTSQQS